MRFVRSPFFFFLCFFAWPKTTQCECVEATLILGMKQLCARYSHIKYRYYTLHDGQVNQSGKVLLHPVLKASPSIYLFIGFTLANGFKRKLEGLKRKLGLSTFPNLPRVWQWNLHELNVGSILNLTRSKTTAVFSLNPLPHTNHSIASTRSL